MDEFQRKNPERVYKKFLEERASAQEEKCEDIYIKISIERRQNTQYELERDYHEWTGL